jgi:TolB protein
MKKSFFLSLVTLAMAGFFTARAAAPDEPPKTDAPAAEKAAPESAGDDDVVPVTVSINPSARQPDPVALPAVFCKPGKHKACERIQEILLRDFSMSGFFEVLNPKSFIADRENESLKKTKWSDWFNVGAKYLIKVEASSSGDKFDLSLRLYDVSLKKTIHLKDEDLKGLSEKEVPRAVHGYVNRVIEAITGSPGFFGSSVVFSQKTSKTTRAIYAVGIDGTGRHVLAGGNTLNMFPSMVGGSLLYTSFRTGFPQLYLNGKRITKDKLHYRGARLSPGGGSIAAAASAGGQSDLFLLSTSGKIKKKLTDTWWDEVSPSWAPEGGQIAFVSNRTGGPQIYVMSAGGGSSRRLTYAGAYNSTPDFGPGGEVAFAGMDEGHSDIFVVDMESNVRRITQDQGSNKDPAFSPDGRHLVFVSSRGGGWRIWLATSDGRYQFQVTPRRGGYSTLFWAR